MLGRPEQAREVLDEVLRQYPDDSLALLTRGQLELLSNRATEAEKWLHRAVRAAPTDYQARW
jgi:predicted Zn-dependent protease